MRKITTFSLVVFFYLSLIDVPTLSGQTNFTVTIYVADGSGWTDSVIIGKNTAATFGIDPGLGESEEPPVPPGGANQPADFRSVDPTGGIAFGQGLSVDIRQLTSDYQRDIYRLAFRRSEPEGTGITLSWQSNLSNFSSGGFYLTDGTGGAIIGVPHIDMTQQTSYTHVSFNGLTGSFVDIIVGDGRTFRTFKSESIALAKDSNEKIGKAEKRKASGSQGCFTFTNSADSTADELYVEWSQIISSHLSYGIFNNTPFATNPVKPQKMTYYGGTVGNGNSTTICPMSNKGKELVAKKWYWKSGGIQLGLTGPALLPDSGTSHLTYNMPNINNIGEELYFQGTFPIDAGSDSVRKMRHFRWKDVLKTLYKKGKAGDLLQTGTPYCLDSIGSKMVTKLVKPTGPDKLVRYKGSSDFGNRLLAELLTLKVNILASAKGKTPVGLGELAFNDTNDPGHPYNGQTIIQIADKADKALSCDTLAGLKGTYTMSDLADLLKRLNDEFSGTFDTLGFMAPTLPKPVGGTVTTGVKALALVDFLQATSPAVSPDQYIDYTTLYDLPRSFSLQQNYPNPFNPTTTIEFTLPHDAFVTLKIYNMLGQEVVTLLDHEDFSEGENGIDFDVANLSTGVYYYRLVVNDGALQQVKKMLLLK